MALTQKLNSYFQEKASLLEILINKITGNNNKKEEFQQVKLDVKVIHTHEHTYMKDNGRNQCYVHSSVAIMG